MILRSRLEWGYDRPVSGGGRLVSGSHSDPSGSPGVI